MRDVPRVDVPLDDITFYEEASGPCPLEVIPHSCDFGVLPDGYDPIEPIRFQIKNTGRVPVKDLRIRISEQDLRRFWLCLAWVPEELGCVGAEDAVTCFYAYPMDGLDVGRHRGRVWIEADGLEPLTVEFRFTVCPGER